MLSVKIDMSEREDYRDISEAKFPGWLRSEMAKKDISVRELAERVGVGISSVYAWIHGRSMPLLSSRKTIVDIFKNTAPAKILIVTPLSGMLCKRCQMVDECMERAFAELPIMCERLTLDDLVVAEHRGIINVVVWWRDIDMDNYESVEELAHELNQ